MNRGIWLASALWLGSALAASGCYMGPQPPPPAYPPGAQPPPPGYGDPGAAPVAADDGTAYPTAPPPDPIPEYQPVAPGYGYSWVGGYWDWTGYDWTWDAGYWAPGDAAYLFVGPRFLFIGGRPVYYRAYWQGPGGYRTYGYGYRGRAPAGGWTARPSVAPGAWRAAPAHNEGWRASPGAAAWRGAPARGVAPMRANEGFRGGAPAARAPAPAARPAAPAYHSAPVHSAPSRGGGGGRIRR